MKLIGFIGSALAIVAAGIMLWGLTVGGWRSSASRLEEFAWALFFVGSFLVLINGIAQWWQ